METFRSLPEEAAFGANILYNIRKAMPLRKNEQVRLIVNKGGNVP